MVTRNQFLAVARKEIGVAERGNNIVKYWDAFPPHANGSPWCARFAYRWVPAQCGMSSNFMNVPEAEYCPSIRTTAKQKGLWIPCKTIGYSGAQPGDLVLFGTSTPTHIGIVVSEGRTTVSTIEGNTSAGNGGSQTNGGQVAARTRPKTWVLGFVRMPLNGGAPAKPVTPMGNLNKALNALKSGAGKLQATVAAEPRGPMPKVAGGYFGDGGTTKHAGIGMIQRKLKKYVDASLDVDNEWGPATKSAVIAWQKAAGLSADGQVGPNTWASM